VDDLLPDAVLHFTDPDFNYELPQRQSWSCSITAYHLQQRWTPLPQEIFVSILSWLPLDSLVRCMRVCREWNQFIQYTGALWEEISCDDEYNVDQSAIELYMKRAGQNGIRKVSLGSSTAMKIDVRLFIKALLQQGVGNLQYLGMFSHSRSMISVWQYAINRNMYRLLTLDMSDWRLPAPDCLQLFDEARLSLRYLNLSNLPWIEIVWKHAILTLENLEHIEYYNCYPELLPDLELPLRRSLKTLRASGSFGVTSNLISRLRQFPNLQEVTLNSIRIRNPLSLSGFIIELPSIRKLHIRMPLWPGFEYPSQVGTQLLTAEYIKKVTTNSCNLEYLSFSSPSALAVCDDELSAVLDGCSQRLAVLKISVSKITDQALLHMVSLKLPCLHTLRIAHCPNISMDGLKLAIKSCPQLVQVELMYLTGMDNTILSCLGDCSFLQIVNIASSKSIRPLYTSKGLGLLVGKSKSLQKVCFLGPNQFESSAMEFARATLGTTNCIFS
jgi:F-box-like